jgi:hypothetical protein
VCIFRAEDGVHMALQPIRGEDEGSMFLWNLCIYLQVHMVLQPRRAEDGSSMFLWNLCIYLQVHIARPTLKSSPPWEPEISHNHECTSVLPRMDVSLLHEPVLIFWSEGLTVKPVIHLSGFLPVESSTSQWVIVLLQWGCKLSYSWATYIDHWDLWFSHWWRCWLWSFGLWCHYVTYKTYTASQPIKTWSTAIIESACAPREYINFEQNVLFEHGYKLIDRTE